MASQAGQARAKQRAAEEEGPSMTVTIGGVAYKAAAKDLTAVDVREIRKQLGYSFFGLLRELETDSDIDLIAGVVWISRRINGERDLDYAEVAAGISYDDLDLGTAAAEPKVDAEPSIGGDDSPEA